MSTRGNFPILGRIRRINTDNMSSASVLNCLLGQIGSESRAGKVHRIREDSQAETTVLPNFGDNLKILF